MGVSRDGVVTALGVIGIIVSGNCAFAAFAYFSDNTDHLYAESLACEQELRTPSLPGAEPDSYQQGFEQCAGVYQALKQRNEQETADLRRQNQSMLIGVLRSERQPGAGR